MKISYSKKGDYYIPNLIPPKNIKGFQLEKYSPLRLKYLLYSYFILKYIYINS